MTILESVLAEKLGLDRQVLRTTRQEATTGLHWKKTPRGIEWTAAGCDWLEQTLAGDGRRVNGRGEALPNEESAELGVVTPDSGEVTECIVVEKNEPLSRRLVNADLVVKQVYKKNTHLLLAVTAAGEPQRVRVQSNRNFIPGMVIPCIHQGADLWTLNGRCPKRRGKAVIRRESI